MQRLEYGENLKSAGRPFNILFNSSVRNVVVRKPCKDLKVQMNREVKKRKRDDSERVDGEPSSRSRCKYVESQQQDAEQLPQSEHVLDLSGKVISSFTELTDVCWKHRDAQEILLRDIFFINGRPSCHADSVESEDSDLDSFGYESNYYDNFDPYYDETESEGEGKSYSYSYRDSNDDSAGGGFYDEFYKTETPINVEDSSDPDSSHTITLLEELKQICPRVRSIDITGCGPNERELILRGYFP